MTFLGIFATEVSERAEVLPWGWSQQGTGQCLLFPLVSLRLCVAASASFRQGTKTRRPEEAEPARLKASFAPMTPQRTR